MEAPKFTCDLSWSVNWFDRRQPNNFIIIESLGIKNTAHDDFENIANAMSPILIFFVINHLGVVFLEIFLKSNIGKSSKILKKNLPKVKILIYSLDLLCAVLYFVC